MRLGVLGKGEEVKNIANGTLFSPNLYANMYPMSYSSTCSNISDLARFRLQFKDITDRKETFNHAERSRDHLLRDSSTEMKSS